jgi:hypothetical protein
MNLTAGKDQAKVGRYEHTEKGKALCSLFEGGSLEAARALETLQIPAPAVTYYPDR